MATTLQESLELFMLKLAATPRRWRLTKRGLIRDHRGRCPLTATQGNARGIRGYMEAASQLGVIPWGFKIANAADQRDTYDEKYDRALRARLLQACGLEPIAETPEPTRARGSAPDRAVMELPA